jgi:hypothetical protein
METKRSFDVLKKLQPAKLYISADGPRESSADDLANTEKVRKIVSEVDWQCDVKVLFHAANLGCRVGVETALGWFFSQENEGIIIEDDIIPNRAFFDYCRSMLEKYRNDERIFSVNGCSVGYKNENEPYGLTRYFNMWGWATWRRSYQLVAPAWSLYDPSIPLEQDCTVKNALHLPILKNANTLWLSHWQKQFRDTHQGLIDTWDFQWFYASLKNDKFCIRPSDNYILNIGFGEDATHHKFTESPIRNLKYTADTYSNNTETTPKVDYNYEIFNVGNLIHSMHLKTWKDVVAGLVPVKLKNLIKSNSLLIKAWQ